MEESAPFPRAAAVADPAALSSAQRGDTTGATPTAGYAAAAAIYNQNGENENRARVAADVNALQADISALRTTVADLLAKLRAAGLSS